MMLGFNLDTRRNSLTITKMHGVTEVRLNLSSIAD